MSTTSLFLGLTLLAALPPLLTAARLWQLKEWRWDRLRAHFASEGIAIQLFGKLRPGILLASILWGIMGAIPTDRYVHATLSTLVLASLMLIALGRQPRPVWTKKAVLLFFTSLLLTVLFAYFLLQITVVGFEGALFLPFLVLAQPFVLSGAWIMWRPVDAILKQRIKDRASVLRRSFPNLIVIGITGSVGKTTTKELLGHVLSAAHPLVTPAHVNSDMGVAAWLLKELPGSSDDRILIVEMGAYAEGEIRELCRIAQPSIGIITHIGNQHIALFGSQERLTNAKAELVEALPPEGHAFLNGDSELCRAIQTRVACAVTIVGTGGPADSEAFDIEERPDSIAFTVKGTSFAAPIHGTHNVTNVLLAIACAEHLGMTLPAIAQMLRTFKPPQQTFEVRTERGVTILDDTHNLSAASFEAAIEWARTQPFEKKYLLAGPLIELGEDQERILTDMGTLASPVFADAFVHAGSTKHFARGFGRPVKTLGSAATRIPLGSLLVCVGRMPGSSITRLLPNS